MDKRSKKGGNQGEAGQTNDRMARGRQTKELEIHEEVNMDFYELEEYYLEEKRNGKEFSEIRKELKVKGIPEEQIRVIIRSVDHKILNDESGLSENKSSREFLAVGIVSLLIGLFFTLGPYLGLFKYNNFLILAFGPILSGIYMITRSISKEKKGSVFKRINRKF